MLDTLEQHAEREGRSTPDSREAWSIRAHGVAERATPTAILVVAVIALVLGTLPMLGLWTMGATDAHGMLAARVSALSFGALLASVAAGSLLLRSGTVQPEAALAAALIAVPAHAVGALAAASWSVGFDEADAGTGRSWFGSATIPLVLVAWLLGATAVAIAVRSSSASQQAASGGARAILVAVPVSICWGVVAVLQPAGAVLVALFVVVSAGLRIRSDQRAAGNGTGRAAAHPAPVPRSGPTPLAPRARRVLALAAALTTSLGVCCVAVALTGSLWLPQIGDSTEAMRAGILAGALVATVTVAIGALALRERLGRAVIAPAAALVAALLVLAASYLGSIDSGFSWPLMLAAAALTGLSGGLGLAPVLPRGRLLRPLLVVCVGLALTVAFGLFVITAAAFIAPLASLGLFVYLLRSGRRDARRGTLPDLRPGVHPA